MHVWVPGALSNCQSARYRSSSRVNSTLLRCEYSDYRPLRACRRQILTYMEQLNEVNIIDIEPLSHVLDQSNIVREDVVSESLDTDQILENAPQSSGKHFVVPKVIEK